jgi:hypothetical protein
MQVLTQTMLQEESELSQWKQLLDRDVEILKAKANISKIQSVSICGWLVCFLCTLDCLYLHNSGIFLTSTDSKPIILNFSLL